MIALYNTAKTHNHTLEMILCNCVENICDPLSENLHSSHNFQFFFIFSAFLKSGYLKFHLNQASSFEVIALDSQKSKKINFYSNHTENKLQALPFVAIALVSIGLQC